MSRLRSGKYAGGVNYLPGENLDEEEVDLRMNINLTLRGSQNMFQAM